jgi:hypothetical protein
MNWKNVVGFIAWAVFALGGSVPAISAGHPGHAGGGAFHRGGGFHDRGFQHGRFQGGYFIGAPLIWPSYHGYPYAYTPYYPPGYIQPGPAATWYYCASAGAYYPNVSQCPEGWQQVPAP